MKFLRKIVDRIKGSVLPDIFRGIQQTVSLLIQVAILKQVVFT
jgi:hypothetical protein